VAYVVSHLMPDGRQLAAHICMAVVNGELEVLKPLVEPLSEEQLDDLFCIDTFGTADNGLTLLDLGCMGGMLNIVEYLYLKGFIFGDENIYVNSPSRTTQQTALHAASVMGHASIATFLVETAGANPLALDRNGQTPFQSACVAGQIAVATYFLGLRAEGCPIDINGTDGTGQSALAWAIHGGHTALVSYLLEQGAV
jgi:ankyrin repeat protein